jgi:hypothetical protein
MQDQPYPPARPLISREADRIQRALLGAGATVTGASISIVDQVADVAWEAPEDGTSWMAVVSPLDTTLWDEWAQDDAPPREDGANDAPAAKDAEMPGHPPAPLQRWRDAEMDEPGQGGAS